jgi:hypothetical protein
MIEMATIVRNSDTDLDVKHDASGTPDCTLVSNKAVQANEKDYRAPSGGLFGAGTLVNTSMSTGYNATAIEGFGYDGGVTASGTVLPNLASGTNTSAVVVDSPSTTISRITAANFTSSRDAVSAVIMHSSVLGEYGYDSTFATDWVLTMPTKRFYVNTSPVIAPFQNSWNGRTSSGNGTACVDVDIDSYDREEGSSFVDDDFSPVTEAGVPQLCWESTVVSFDKASGPSSVLGSTNVAHFGAYQATGAAGGWAEITFGNSQTSYAPVLVALPTSQQTSVTDGGILPAVSGSVTFGGLPVIGFSIVAAKFPASSDNYNASYNLNFRRNITSGQILVAQ